MMMWIANKTKKLNLVCYKKKNHFFFWKEKKNKDTRPVQWIIISWMLMFEFFSSPTLLSVCLNVYWLHNEIDFSATTTTPTTTKNLFWKEFEFENVCQNHSGDIQFNSFTSTNRPRMKMKWKKWETKFSIVWMVMMTIELNWNEWKKTKPGETIQVQFENNNYTFIWKKCTKMLPEKQNWKISTKLNIVDHCLALKAWILFAFTDNGWYNSVFFSYGNRKTKTIRWISVLKLFFL